MSGSILNRPVSYLRYNYEDAIYYLHVLVKVQQNVIVKTPQSIALDQDDVAKGYSDFIKYQLKIDTSSSSSGTLVHEATEVAISTSGSIPPPSDDPAYGVIVETYVIQGSGKRKSRLRYTDAEIDNGSGGN